MEPVTPTEAAKNYKDNEKLPDWAINIFNELILKTFNGKYAAFSSIEVDMAFSGTGQPSSEIKVSELENTFSKVGWKVEYLRPSSNEPFFIPHFKFTI